MGHEVIDAVKAARLISEYSQEIKANTPFLSKEIGGIFHAQDFRKWFENERELSIEFVFQTEIADSKRIFIEAIHPSHAQFITPLSLFEAPESASEIDMLSFIHRQRKSEGNAIAHGDWNAFREAHQQALTNQGINRANKFEMAYSKRENSFDMLLHVRKTEVLYIRYFFGLRKKHNKQLSLILAPVDIAGRNIMVLPDGTSAPWIEIH
jgi:hypothetical protein